jgi:hypothetical protein
MRIGLILVLLAGGCASGYRELEFANARVVGKVEDGQALYHNLTTNRPAAIAILLPGEFVVAGDKLTPKSLDSVADSDRFLASGCALSQSKTDKNTWMIRWPASSPGGTRCLLLTFEEDHLVTLAAIVPADMPRGLTNWSPAFSTSVQGNYRRMPLTELELSALFGPVLKRRESH